MRKTLRRVAATTIAALLTIVAMLSVASVAQAANLKGKTEQGKNAALQVQNSTGTPTRFVIAWETSRCTGQAASYRDKTTFNGFKNESPARFATKGNYKTRQSGGFRSTVRVRVSGDRRGANRWNGSFSAKVRIKKNGKRFGSCTLNGDNWAVSGN